MLTVSAGDPVDSDFQQVDGKSYIQVSQCLNARNRNIHGRRGW